MKRPLAVREKLTTFQLVDADGKVIASAPVRDWHGAPESERPEVVRANLETLAAAANCQVPV